MPRERLGLTRAVLARSARGMALLAACCGLRAAQAAVELPLTDGSVLRFAEIDEGAQALAKRDDYILQLSPFDRQVRLRAERAVSPDEFAAFAASHVRSWRADEIEKLTPLVAQLRQKLQPWKLPLPERVLLVKTSGREESGAAYCRGPAIVLPEAMVAAPKSALERVLPHEVFHILSSHNPSLREALYGVIGFHACNEVTLPQSLAERKITNPDAPLNNHYIQVEEGGQPMELMPVLVSKSDRYEPARGGSLFSYLDFKLLALTDDGGTRRAALSDGKPILLEPSKVEGFMDQVGRNTNYLIHPEEILADNFVFLVNGRIDLPTPRVVTEMGNVLQQASGRK